MTYRKETREAGLKEWRRYSPETRETAWEEVPREEMRDLERVIERAYRRDPQGTQRALRDWAVTRHRLKGKARKDADTDHRTRVLVGARVPREYAALVKTAASGTGRSVYRFVRDALEREIQRSMD